MKSPGTSLRLLCSADLHIGRRSTRLPAALADDRRFSTGEAWLRLVECARREAVDFVLLSGDLIDRENRFFEALGPLERGLRELDASGIEVIAVAGNHDFDVLPRISDLIPDSHFHVLGRGGRWEERVFEREGRPVLQVHGWSFPTEWVSASPLNACDLTPHPEIPTIGMVHADFNQPVSRYAPVMPQDLARCPLGLWLIGHIHLSRQSAPEDPFRMLNPGSPQAMDPGEPGLHGVWLVEFSGPSVSSVRQIPLSTVFYERLEISVEGLSGVPELHRLVTEQIRRRVEELSLQPQPLLCVSLRILMTGRTRLHGTLQQELKHLAELAPTSGELVGYIDRVTIETRPEVDLEALAGRRDPPGVLARWLLELAGNDLAETESLWVQGTERLRDVHAELTYLGISGDRPLDGEAVRRRIRRVGFALLDQLLQQQGEA